MVNIVGLDKAVVLQALHCNSKAQAISFMHEREITLNECQQVLASGQTYFDYFAGRVMKVDLEYDEFDPWGYDRDNGAGAAQAVVDALR